MIMNDYPRRQSALPDTIKVLLVEDDDAYVSLLSKMLRRAKNVRFMAERVDSLQKAVDYLSNNNVDVILLDLHLPDGHGLDTLDFLHDLLSENAVVVLTSLDDESAGIKALQKGAQDYIVKANVTDDMLTRSISYAIERHILLMERKQVEKVKEEVISVVSHELRGPLTAIINSLSLIADGETGEISEQTKKLIGIAYRSSERLLRLANDMLDIGKIESGKMEFNFQICELAPLLEQSIDANRSYAKQFNVQIELDNTIPDAKVKVDCDRLIQILTNLITNAAKFSPPDSEINISLSRYNHSIRISVEDKGPGIPEDFRHRIFDKFAQSQMPGMRRKDGAGLGLSIAKMLVELMGGSIGFKTETNVGTTFYFDLPEYNDDDLKNA
jgi:signal transduction histidine kinase